MNACWELIGPASSRTVRSPSASLPIERPRVSVSSVVGKTTKTRMIVPIRATVASAASVPIVATPAIRMITNSSSSVTSTSISPEAIRRPEAGRRQVEGDGLTGDQVIGRQRRELRGRHRHLG